MPENTTEKSNHYAIGFYNLENLFDTINDKKTLDDDFTVNSPRKWNEKRFQKKIANLGAVISKMGLEKIGFPPVLLGVAEVENKIVLEHLVTSKQLQSLGYSFVHFDSPDERGIDTALLYRCNYFSVLQAKTHTLLVHNEFGERDFTRDILHVVGKLDRQEIHVLVNHWPSRRQGALETGYKRMAAAQKILEIIASILKEDPNARIIIMGDFNDDPHSESVKMVTTDFFYNPMEVLLSKYQGSLHHEETWHLFDQLMVSYNFLQGGNNAFQFKSAHIYNPREIREYKEQYKNLPLRSYVGKKYLGGYSDHFPVYAIFSLKTVP
ncbi:MAG: endonuclease [Flavobacteriaceae bacterium]